MEKSLIVDDEEVMRRLVRINLKDRYEIIDTGNPEEALAMALQEQTHASNHRPKKCPIFPATELCRTFKSMLLHAIDA